MKSLLRTLPLAALILASSAFAQSESDSLAKEKAKLPDAIRKIAEQGDPGIPAAQASAEKAVKTAKAAATKEDANSPAKWSKNEVHKLAVMDVKFGGNTETIMFELFADASPKTVANFIENVQGGAYKGLAFHRAIDNYLVQTGDPLTADDSQRNAWGTGGEDKTVAGEFKLSHKVGAVAMARRSDKVNPDRRSNGYQFYFTLGNLSGLDGSYTVFGQVVSGLETLQAISRVPVDSNDCPLSRIEVKNVRVIDQKGPLIVMKETNGTRHSYTKPAGAKGTLTRFIERVW